MNQTQLDVALWRAVANKNVDIAKGYLAKGANPNARFQMTDLRPAFPPVSSLALAVSVDRPDIQMLNLLIDAGAHGNDEGRFNTYLNLVKSRDYATLKKLVAKGVMDGASQKLCTVYAAKESRHEIFSWLVSQGMLVQWDAQDMVDVLHAHCKNSWVSPDLRQRAAEAQVKHLEMLREKGLFKPVEQQKKADWIEVAQDFNPLSILTAPSFVDFLVRHINLAGMAPEDGNEGYGEWCQQLQAAQSNLLREHLDEAVPVTSVAKKGVRL